MKNTLSNLNISSLILCPAWSRRIVLIGFKSLDIKVYWRKIVQEICWSLPGGDSCGLRWSSSDAGSFSFKISSWMFSWDRSSLTCFWLLQKNHIKEETIERMRLDEEVIVDFFREYISVSVSAAAFQFRNLTLFVGVQFTHNFHWETHLFVSFLSFFFSVPKNLIFYTYALESGK